MPCDLDQFGLTEMLRCSLGLRKAAGGAASFEEAADRICRFFYDEFRDADTGERQLVLARMYKTHPYGALDAAQRAFADRLLPVGAAAGPELRCLCLLATVGVEAAWNNRRRSRGHQVIPLPSPEIVEQAPMIAELVRGLGLDLAAVVRPAGDLLHGLDGRTYGVFHVEDAPGSPYIPAQEEFVAPYGVRSVVGFGGALRSGNIFAGVLFSRAHISHQAADRFRSLALDAKVALFEFSEAETFRAAGR